MTPSERTLDYYRKRGWTIERVEQTIRYPDKFKKGKMTMFKRDLGGFADYLAWNGNAVVAIQSTVQTEKQRHIDKILAEPKALLFVRSGICIVLICWRTLKTEGRDKWIPERIVFGICNAELVTLPLTDEQEHLLC